jgi:hypothetical protein
VCVCVCVCMYVCMHACMHARMHVCMCSFIVTMYEYQQSTSVHNFSQKCRDHLQNSRCQKGEMKQLSLGGPTNIRRHGTQFRRPGELALGVFVKFAFSVRVPTSMRSLKPVG